MKGVYKSGGEWGYSKNRTFTDVSEFGTITGVEHTFVFGKRNSSVTEPGLFNFDERLKLNRRFIEVDEPIGDPEGFYAKYDVFLDGNLNPEISNKTHPWSIKKVFYESWSRKLREDAQPVLDSGITYNPKTGKQYMTQKRRDGNFTGNKSNTSPKTSSS